MDWKEEPATQQQLLRLQEYGFVPTFPLTVTQAARLIRQYKHPQRPAAASALEPPAAKVQILEQEKTVPRPEPLPRVMTRQSAPPAPVGKVSESARSYVLQLRLNVESCECALVEHPDRPGGKADVHSAVSARQRFWLDTCRDGFDLQAASAQAIEFHDHYGLHYFPPTWDEVAEILVALDTAMPGWDQDHPELFYETLRLNFPSLQRHK